MYEIFEQPELFHLGLDEENAEQQEEFDYVIYRQFDLIWHDLNFYFDCVRECGSRPWIWADWAIDYNIDHQFRFCEERISPEHYKGILIAPWAFTTQRGKARLIQAIELTGEAVNKYWK